MLTLPQHLRDTLKTTPIGTLVPDEKQLLEALNQDQPIISVGDRVSATLLKYNIQPWVIIVDYIHKRTPVSPEIQQLLSNYGETIKKIKNPAGCISDDLWNTLKEHLAKPVTHSIRVDIDGEEDLAALAAIALAPLGATIIYGVPNKGVVLVLSSQEHKDVVNDILQQM